MAGFHFAGFYSGTNVFADRYADLNGNSLRVTHPTRAVGVYFQRSLEFPNGTVVADGIDTRFFEDYLAGAMNIAVEWVPVIDGAWGNLVDKETNAFNGMIGMIQRGVGGVTVHNFCRGSVRKL